MKTAAAARPFTGTDTMPDSLSKASGAELLAIRDLRMGYGSGPAAQVLGGISFAAREGEFLSVVGPSGCGKTTLLLVLAGLLRPDHGTISFAGTPILNGTPDGIAIVFQDYSRSLFPWKTVLDNVLFGMRRQRGVNRSERNDNARGLIAAVGLSGTENRYPWQLSGGMQQRVAIARGLASRSRLLLLDEPMAAVDAQTRADVQDLLLSLAQRFNQTCVLVTHDVDEAVYMADRIVVLSTRPTQVVEEIATPLGRPRDQIETREQKLYLEIRHEVLSIIRNLRKKSGELK